MTVDERCTALLLAFVFSLRMLGIFLILPVFSLYARELPSGNNMVLVGLALGAYGLTQMLLQIVYGVASDRFGRKFVIVFGLLLFAAGSYVAALSTDIYGIIIGRVLQGGGAISVAVTALAADLARPQQMTKTMVIIGSSIGLMFALSMVGAPLLYAKVGMPGIFFLMGSLSLLAIFVITKMIEDVPSTSRQPGWPSFVGVVKHPQLLRINFGVFILYLVQTAMWVWLPSALVGEGGLPADELWKIYLPAVLASFVFLAPAIVAAEKRGRMKFVFNAAIVLLLIVQLGFAFFADGPFSQFVWLLLFFIAFNILEATQPSLIARFSPADAKGAALGVYNTTQSLGLFLGGLLGGVLVQRVGTASVLWTSAVLIVVWLLVGLTMVMPAVRRK
ncbi:MFS transporter [Propionivibrio limicola]|uniref:MFS transporter n=1 Tax=Propionivibrio limicola TaxID=167645 RepID=UPI0012918735|nr:MFS transporter [Propionivibrio limicola]